MTEANDLEVEVEQRIERGHRKGGIAGHGASGRTEGLKAIGEGIADYHEPTVM